MREYIKVTETYTKDKLSKCNCDKCGKICDYIVDENYEEDRSTLVKIRPRYGNDDSISLDLCTDCTKELLKWFPKNHEIELFEDSLKIWEMI